MSKHNITILEIETILDHKFLLCKIQKFPLIYELLGYTSNQRPLVVILKRERKNKFIIITAYDAEKEHKRLYNKKVNK